MAEQFAGRMQQILAAAARTAAVTGDDLNIEDDTARGAHVIIKVSTASGFTITPTIQGKTAFGDYYDILVGAGITASGTTVLKVYPGLTPSANAVANDVLPDVWRVNIAVADATSVSYSVAANLME